MICFMVISTTFGSQILVFLWTAHVVTSEDSELKQCMQSKHELINTAALMESFVSSRPHILISLDCNTALKIHSLSCVDAAPQTVVWRYLIISFNLFEKNKWTRTLNWVWSPSKLLASDQHTCFQAENEKMHLDRKQNRSWPGTLCSPLSTRKHSLIGVWNSGCGLVEAPALYKPGLSQLLAVMGSVM